MLFKFTYAWCCAYERGKLLFNLTVPSDTTWVFNKQMTRSEYESETLTCKAQFRICGRSVNGGQVKGDIFIAMECCLCCLSYIQYDLRHPLRQRRPHMRALTYTHTQNNNVGEDMHCPAVCNPSRALQKPSMQPWSLWQQQSTGKRWVLSTFPRWWQRRERVISPAQKASRSQCVSSELIRQHLSIENSELYRTRSSPSHLNSRKSALKEARCCNRDCDLLCCGYPSLVCLRRSWSGQMWGW